MDLKILKDPEAVMVGQEAVRGSLEASPDAPESQLTEQTGTGKSTHGICLPTVKSLEALLDEVSPGQSPPGPGTQHPCPHKLTHVPGSTQQTQRGHTSASPTHPELHLPSWCDGREESVPESLSKDLICGLNDTCVDSLNQLLCLWCPS